MICFQRREKYHKGNEAIEGSIERNQEAGLVYP